MNPFAASANPLTLVGGIWRATSELPPPTSSSVRTIAYDAPSTGVSPSDARFAGASPKPFRARPQPSWRPPIPPFAVRFAAAGTPSSRSGARTSNAFPHHPFGLGRCETPSTGHSPLSARGFGEAKPHRDLITTHEAVTSSLVARTLRFESAAVDAAPCAGLTSHRLDPMQVHLRRGKMRM